MNKLLPLFAILAIILGALYWLFGLPPVDKAAELPASSEAIARGEYLYNAGVCASCHQLGEAAGPSGGLELESPFGGVFHAPNITPDEETGIGGWTGRDFILAMKHGRSPNGGFYWPSFPYRSYRGMTDQDVLDLGAYLMAQPAIRNDVPHHDIPGWQFRWMMAGWNILANFLEGELPPLADDPQIQRGAYLARALGHCGECHTPRNALGMSQLAREFAGSSLAEAPAIDAEALAGWTAVDFVGLLELGMTASFDFVGGEMAEVVEHTSRLTEDDKEAYAAFFVSGGG